MQHREGTNVAISVTEQMTPAASHREQQFAGIGVANKDMTHTGTGWNNALLRKEMGQDQLP